MPMLISKFNRMIRNKVFWGIFAFLVSASFVVYFAPQGSSAGAPVAERVDAGKLNGRTVPMREFRDAKYFALNLQQSHVPREYEKQLNERAWIRLAALDMAHELGLTVGREELQNRIATDEAFQENGAFSEQRYRAILGQYLKVSEATFTEYLRESVLLEKLYGAIDAAAWVPPAALERQVRNFTDTFEVDVAAITRDDVEVDVAVDESDVSAFFASNEELFRVPDQRMVDYVFFPYTNTVAADDVSEEAIQDYYQRHPGEMLVLVTNIVPRAVATDASNATAVAQAMQTNILEETGSIEMMRGYIVDQVRERMVRERAMAGAHALLNIMLPGDGSVVPFRVAAGQIGTPVATSSWFTASAPPVDHADAGPLFTEEAFRLDPSDPQRAFSEPVRGERGVYVLSFREEIESHIPALETVAEEARMMAERDAREAAYTEQVESIRASVADALRNQNTFADALAAHDLNVTTSFAFNVASVYYGVQDPNRFVEEMIPDVFFRRGGELTEPIPSSEGMLLVHVRSRTEAEPATRNTYRSDMYNQLSRGHAEANHRAWRKALLEQANVKPEEVAALPADS